MREFSELLDRLLLTPSRSGKLKLLADHFGATPDPDRGYALAAITGELGFASVKPAMLRALVVERMDPVLFEYSYDYVGDLAETVSLVWPERSADTGRSGEPRLSAVIDRLAGASRADGPAILAGILDQLDTSGRFAAIKLVTGGLRIGVSARLAKQALADWGGVAAAEIEEMWHGLDPPYTGLFGWLEGRTSKPVNSAGASFRPVMLAHALQDKDLPRLDPSDFAVEWKWDGIRVQVAARDGIRRIYSRTGDDITGSFPDLAEAIDFDGTIDGELLVRGSDGAAGTFSDLQQRLNRKSVSARILTRYPVFVRCYDLLQAGVHDLRQLAFRDRRARLENFVLQLDPQRFDLSPLVAFEHWQDLDNARTSPPHPIIEGVMLKRWDSAYVPGRPKGPWFKWKRDPHRIDAVLMYAQRGHGKRSSYYSDYTFGVWTGSEDAPELVPVGKSYFGFTDEELRALDKYVRDNTVDRYGPVRAVRAEPGHGLVMEIAFEGLSRSKRHRSGLAMRFPRVSRLRWDKPAIEADRLEALQALLDPVQPD